MNTSVPIASSTSKIANQERSSQHGADQIPNSQIRDLSFIFALAIAIISDNTGVLLCSSNSTATTSSRKLRNIKDDFWHTLEAFSARRQKLLEDMTNAEEVQCCRDRDTPTNHKGCLDEFRQMY